MATLSQAGIAGIGTGIGHPKQQNKWRVIFSGLGGTIGAQAGVPNDLSMQVITWSRPSLTWEDFQLDRYNSRAYFIGKHSFDYCQFTVEDDITNKATNAIRTQAERQQRLIGATGPWLNTEATAYGYKFGVMFEQLDGYETVVETWKYEGCMFTAIDFGQVDYSTGDKITISLTMRYDHVRQVLVNAVTGSAIGGLLN
jgi:hypothetical protein